MDGHAHRSGGFTRLEDSAYNDRVVVAFFGLLATISIVAISAAVIVSAVLGRAGGVPMSAGMPGMTGPAAIAAQRSPAPAVRSVLHVTIAGSVAKGPDGKMHDAFSVTNYAVHVGQPVSLVIDNADSAPHTITAPAVGVNIIAKQGIHTYTLVVQRAGRFFWFCALPCDTDAHGWAMSKPGFMSGYITAS